MNAHTNNGSRLIDRLPACAAAVLAAMPRHREVTRQKIEKATPQLLADFRRQILRELINEGLVATVFNERNQPRWIRVR